MNTPPVNTDAMRIVYRNAVQQREVDQMGHMNVLFYVFHIVQAVETLWVTSGFAPKERPRLTQQHIRFLAEQHPGTPLFIRVGVLQSDTPSELALYLEMCHALTEQPFAVFTQYWEHREGGKPAPWPQDFIAQLPPLAERPPHGATRGLQWAAPRTPVPTLAEAQAKPMVTSWLGPTPRRLCERDGRLDEWGVIGIISDAVPNLVAGTRKLAASKGGPFAQGQGGGVLEYRIVHYDRPQIGEVLQLFSAVSTFGSKTYNWVHWLISHETGRAVATAEAVVISFDMQTRKSVEIAPEMRAMLEKQSLPDLTP